MPRATPCPKLVPEKPNFDFAKRGSLDSPRHRETQARTVPQLGRPGDYQPDVEPHRQILIAGEPHLTAIDRKSPAAAIHRAVRRAFIPNGKFDGIPRTFQGNLARDDCLFDMGALRVSHVWFLHLASSACGGCATRNTGRTKTDMVQCSCFGATR